MPARRIDTAQVVGNVNPDEAAVYIFKGKAAFIRFQDFGKGLIRLLLLQLGPGRHTAEMTVDADDVDVVDAQPADMFRHDFFQGFNRRLMFQQDWFLLPQPRYRREGRCIGLSRFYCRSVA